MKKLSKKQQIEIIIDELKKIYNLEVKINKLFKSDIDMFESVYDIGYKLIPVILDIKDYNEQLDDELGDLFFNYICGDITKKEYFNEIDKYLEV